jgi:hypothetical protein
LIIVIIMQKSTLIFAFCFAAGSVAFDRTTAQAAPPAFQLPASAQFPTALPSAGGTNQSPTTKVVRIYNGAGSFDDALAEKFRPMLAKTFHSSTTDPVKAATAEPDATPTQLDSQKKVAPAPHL